MIPVSHSEKSILLAGDPIARIEPATLYPQMNDLNKAKITVINFYQSDKKIFCIYLTPI